MQYPVKFLKIYKDVSLTGCNRLLLCLFKEVEIPERVGVIADSVFSNSPITSITMNRIYSVGSRAFSNTKNLQSATFKEFYQIENHAFANSGLTNLELGAVYYQKNDATIGKYAFSNTKLKSVTIPYNVVMVGEGAFSECKELESVTFLSNGTGSPSEKQELLIGSRAFAKCEKLKEIVIPGSVQTVEEGTFELCTQLEKVTLLDGVNVIKGSAFACCVNLKTINIPSSVRSISGTAFPNKSSIHINYAGTEQQWRDLISETKEDYESLYEGLGELAKFQLDKNVTFNYTGK